MGATAFESVRGQEIGECRSGEVVTWGDGQDSPAVTSTLSFTRSPADPPAGFPETLVAGMAAGAVWSQCGVRGQVRDWAGSANQASGVIVAQWSESETDRQPRQLRSD